MRILNLIRKDLLQIWRDPKTLAFMLLMPLAFTAFFGYVFKPGAETDPRLQVAIINRDVGSALSDDIYGLFETSSVIRPVTLSAADEARVDALLADDKLASAVIIPSGYADAFYAGEGLLLTAIIDRNTSVGQTTYPAVQSVLLRLQGAAQVAQVNVGLAEQTAPFADAAARREFASRALTLALEAWRDPALTVSMEAASAAEEKASPYGTNPYTQSSPGMIVQFCVYGLITAAASLVLERKSGTLKRLVTTPISRAGIIGAKALALFIMVFAQIMILVLVGDLLWDVPYLTAPLATLVMLVATAMFSASLGLLISAISKGEEQVIMWSLIAMFVLSALGGAWFPLEITGETFARIGHLLPMAWAMDGLQNIALRGLGLGSVWLPAGVLVAWALVCLALAVWRFRFE